MAQQTDRSRGFEYATEQLSITAYGPHVNVEAKQKTKATMMAREAKQKIAEGDNVEYWRGVLQAAENKLAEGNSATKLLIRGDIDVDQAVKQLLPNRLWNEVITGIEFLGPTDAANTKGAKPHLSGPTDAALALTDVLMRGYLNPGNLAGVLDISDVTVYNGKLIVDFVEAAEQHGEARAIMTDLRNRQIDEYDAAYLILGDDRKQFVQEVKFETATGFYPDLRSWGEGADEEGQAVDVLTEIIEEGIEEIDKTTIEAASVEGNTLVVRFGPV